VIAESLTANIGHSASLRTFFIRCICCLCRADIVVTAVVTADVFPAGSSHDCSRALQRRADPCPLTPRNAGRRPPRRGVNEMYPGQIKQVDKTARILNETSPVYTQNSNKIT